MTEHEQDRIDEWNREENENNSEYSYWLSDNRTDLMKEFFECQKQIPNSFLETDTYEVVNEYYEDEFEKYCHTEFMAWKERR